MINGVCGEIRKPYGILCDGPLSLPGRFNYSNPPKDGWLLSTKRPEGKKLTVFLDVDETLVHYSWSLKNIKEVRPGSREFVKKLQSNDDVELVLFSAGTIQHVSDVLDLIDIDIPRGNILARNSCCIWNGVYVKDLSRTGRDIKESILIDDSPTSGLFQPQNLIQVPRYMGSVRPCEMVVVEEGMERHRIHNCGGCGETGMCKSFQKLLDALDMKGAGVIDYVQEVKKRYSGKTKKIH